MGGSDHPDNLCTSCSACNAGKAGEPLDQVSRLIAEQRADALCFWALDAILANDPQGFVADCQAIAAVQDFIASASDPVALIKIARQSPTWAETKRAWLEAEGFPADFWSPSNIEAPE